MRNSPLLKTAAIILVTVLSLVALSACSGQFSAAALQTAVAGTLAAAPANPVDVTKVVEVTRVVDVTRIVEVKITSTPQPTGTPTPTPTLEASLSVTDTAVLTGTAAVTETLTTALEPTLTPTFAETGKALGFTLNQLINKFLVMTDLQRENYVASLAGQTVIWSAQLYNITTDGLVQLDNPNSIGTVTLKGVPQDVALKMDKGMLVDFYGVIEKFEGAASPHIVLTDVKIYRYYLPPSATPTP